MFDSCNVAGFILCVDKKFSLANKTARKILGDVIGVLKTMIDSA